MRTVYVVTTKPGGRGRTVRRLAALIAARVVFLLAYLGHILTLLAGAVDALVTALLGVPRITYGAGRLARVVRETWEADL